MVCVEIYALKKIEARPQSTTKTDSLVPAQRRRRVRELLRETCAMAIHSAVPEAEMVFSFRMHSCHARISLHRRAGRRALSYRNKGPIEGSWPRAGAMAVLPDILPLPGRRSQWRTQDVRRTTEVLLISRIADKGQRSTKGTPWALFHPPRGKLELELEPTCPDHGFSLRSAETRLRAGY